jgi:CheY-like chemotaxis protein
METATCSPLPFPGRRYGYFPYPEDSVNPVSTANTILVVAEESDTRVFVSNLLNTEGFNPIGAAGMPEGLRLARSRRPALIILDVMMPNKEGIRIYHRIKNDPVLKTVPVIMLSAIDRETFYLYEKFQSTPLGPGVPEPDAYLEKPPEADDLIRLVHTFITAIERKKSEWIVFDSPETK